MSDDSLPPVCQAPSCRETAGLRFMGITPLCAKHAIKANRRAAVNVLVVGAGLALVGGILLVLGDLAHPAVGASTLGGGGIVAGLAPFYLRAARRLESGR